MILTHSFWTLLFTKNESVEVKNHFKFQMNNEIDLFLVLDNVPFSIASILHCDSIAHSHIDLDQHFSCTRSIIQPSPNCMAICHESKILLMMIKSLILYWYWRHKQIGSSQKNDERRLLLWFAYRTVLFVPLLKSFLFLRRSYCKDG